MSWLEGRHDTAGIGLWCVLTAVPVGPGLRAVHAPGVGLRFVVGRRAVCRTAACHRTITLSGSHGAQRTVNRCDDGYFEEKGDQKVLVTLASPRG